MASNYDPMSDSEGEEGGKQLDDNDDDDEVYHQPQPLATRDLVADASSIPDSLKGLRACKACQLIKTFEQFQRHGCDNCNWHDEDVQGRTSAKFAGMLALIKPSESWIAAATFDAKARVSQVQAPATRKPGVYALSLPIEVEEFDGEESDDGRGYRDDYRGGRRAGAAAADDDEEEEDEDDAAYSDHE